MRKKIFEKYKEQTDKRISELEATVDFLARNGKYDIEFVYKNEAFTQTKCFARYIYNGNIKTSLIEIYPYSSVKSHKVINNTSDYVIISSLATTYKLDKKTERCLCIDNVKGAI